MGKEWQKDREKSQGWWWKAPLIVVLALTITLFILIFNINSIALSRINASLGKTLSTGGHLNTFDLQLSEGQLALSDLTLKSPEGFGAIPPLTMKSLKVSVEIRSLLNQPIIINEITLDELAITMVRNKQGKLNVLQLLPKNNNAPTTSPDSEKNEARSEEADEPLLIPAIRVKNLRINNLTLQVIDQLIGEKWTANVTLNLAVENVQLNDVMSGDILVDKLNLATGNLSVDQLPGFSKAPLLNLDEITLTANSLNFNSPNIALESIVLKELAVSVEQNSDRESNIEQLVSSWQAKSDYSAAKEATIESTTTTPQKPLPIINIEHFLLNNSSLTYSDAALASTLMTFPLDNIELEAKRLRLFDDNPKAVPASLSLTLELKQPESLPTAYIGAIAVMGPINTGIPAMNSQVRIGGFKLDTIDPLIPPSSRTAIGANGFDAAVAIALNHQAINLKASVLSDQNIAYNAIAIKGPISAPTIEMGAILAGVYSRFSDGLLNFGKGGLNAGLDIASSSVDIAGAVGSGTISIGKNLGESLFEAGTGLLTLDQKQLRHGLVGTSKGTLDIGYDSVAESGSAAQGGIKGSYNSLDGSNSLKAWNDGIKARYEHSMQKAEGALLQMTYPPTTQ